jgi:hypothetical protein
MGVAWVEGFSRACQASYWATGTNGLSRTLMVQNAGLRKRHWVELTWRHASTGAEHAKQADLRFVTKKKSLIPRRD